jgi:hypothetical protein
MKASAPQTAPRVPAGSITGRRFGAGALVLLVALGGACGGMRGQLVGDVYRDGPVAFRVGPLPAAWQRVQVADGHLAFHHRAGGTIVASANCDRFIDLSLDLLTNQLLYGVEGRQELGRTRIPLDGRIALRTRMNGALDGVPIALDMVVLKKDGCTYDLVLASSPKDQRLRQPDFERFFAAFALAEVAVKIR